MEKEINMVCEHGPKLTVRDSPGAGRGIFTREACRKGELLFACNPFAYTVDKKVSSILCHSCLKKASTLSRCSKCHKTKYCSRDCQTNDWSIHKRECKALRTAPRALPDSAILLCRIVSALDAKDQFIAQSDLSVLSGDQSPSSDEAAVASIVAVAKTFIAEQGGVADWLGANDLIRIMKMIITNSFSICDLEMQPIGVGVYITASLLNHSCTPNSVVTFNGITLTVRATRDLPANTEITISYIDVLAPTETRQQELSPRHFICHCPLCTTRKDETDLMAMGVKCENQLCPGLYLKENSDEPGVCSQGCSQKGINLKQFLTVTKQLEDLRKTVGESIDSYQEQFTDLLEFLSNLVPPTNIALARMANKAMDLDIDRQLWNTAIDHGKAAIPAMRMMYGDCHPLLGIQLMKLGKLMLLDDPVPINCADLLREALLILEVTHGDGQMIPVECYSMWQQAIAECHRLNHDE